ncbi:hypothetical protein LQV63_24915 [Paenibacillus profundus]|uniref:GIY-YIG domain-containing protein n=1 Tax=Paenibacillus profundus TaxID=1173085 RepID=A0ABS8YKX4_9BACL|nr:hypothetical protein [Paenibacillus profundus]MCE5172520.1 hypothetical protein [Paenibacillus profundus]
MPVRKKLEELESQKTLNEERYHEDFNKAYEFLLEKFTLDRHPTLRIWRNRNPVNIAEVPQCLANIRHVKRLEITEPSYVYFLLMGEEIVYVGQTTSPWPARILQHLKSGDKEFDDVWYLEVDRPSVSRVETEFIRKFQPKYNRAKVGNVHRER